MTAYIRQAQVPPVAYRYFGQGVHPIITQVYRPDGDPTAGGVNRGWKRHPIRKRVSGSWLRGLRREGATMVQLSDGARLADFTVAELLAKRA